jgi:hypothetical protein
VALFTHLPENTEENDGEKSGYRVPNWKALHLRSREMSEAAVASVNFLVLLRYFF